MSYGYKKTESPKLTIFTCFPFQRHSGSFAVILGLDVSIVYGIDVIKKSVTPKMLGGLLMFPVFTVIGSD
jgi:hypothetical protein